MSLVIQGLLFNLCFFPEINLLGQKEIKLNSKPWITKELLTSIKTNNKLFTNYVKNNNQENKTNYKNSWVRANGNRLGKIIIVIEKIVINCTILL